MNYAIIKKLPSTDEIIAATPLSDAGYRRILQDRQEVKAILAGKDDPRINYCRALLCLAKSCCITLRREACVTK